MSRRHPTAPERWTVPETTADPEYTTRHLTPDTWASEEFGFARDRRIAKWRWVMRRRVPAA